MITDESRRADVLLIDCLTLWISNIFAENNNQEEYVRKQVQNLSRSMEKARCPIILVSNEVGTGIVPENKLARRFRDIMGFVNQQIAEISSHVIWLVAGIPVTIKGPNSP